MQPSMKPLKQCTSSLVAASGFVTLVWAQSGLRRCLKDASTISSATPFHVVSSNSSVPQEPLQGERACFGQISCCRCCLLVLFSLVSCCFSFFYATLVARCRCVGERQQTSQRAGGQSLAGGNSPSEKALPRKNDVSLLAQTVPFCPDQTLV